MVAVGTSLCIAVWTGWVTKEEFDPFRNMVGIKGRFVKFSRSSRLTFKLTEFLSTVTLTVEACAYGAKADRMIIRPRMVEIVHLDRFSNLFH